jgi:predicted enzyme related to lactoylglutathione lyase
MMMMPQEVPAEAPAHWTVYFAVSDCAAFEQKAAALGGQVLHSTTDIEVGKFAVLADPQGATFHLLESTKLSP